MTMKYCSFCERDYEKVNFYRHINSNKHQLKTSRSTKFDDVKISITQKREVTIVYLILTIN